MRGEGDEREIDCSLSLQFFLVNLDKINKSKGDLSLSLSIFLYISISVTFSLQVLFPVRVNTERETVDRDIFPFNNTLIFPVFPRLIITLIFVRIVVCLLGVQSDSFAFLFVKSRQVSPLVPRDLLAVHRDEALSRDDDSLSLLGCKVAREREVERVVGEGEVLEERAVKDDGQKGIKVRDAAAGKGKGSKSAEGTEGGKGVHGGGVGGEGKDGAGEVKGGEGPRHGAAGLRGGDLEPGEGARTRCGGGWGGGSGGSGGSGGRARGGARGRGGVSWAFAAIHAPFFPGHLSKPFFAPAITVFIGVDVIIIACPAIAAGFQLVAMRIVALVGGGEVLAVARKILVGKVQVLEIAERLDPLHGPHPVPGHVEPPERRKEPQRLEGLDHVL